MMSLRKSVRVTEGHDSSPVIFNLKKGNKSKELLAGEQQVHLDVSQQSIGRNQDLTEMRMPRPSSSL